jgi:uncharacterized protein Yka (UPF0111/DUF47 family)
MRNKMVLEIEKTRTKQLKSLKKEINQLEFSIDDMKGTMMDSSCYILS